MNRYSPKHLLQQKKTVITAHSGCEGTPDNSREHILAAIASGAEMIEVDVRQAPDGTLILSHDVPEDISVRVTLRELFELIEPEKNMEMNLDVKTSGLVEPVMQLAKEFDLAGRILFTGECNNDRALAVSLGAEVWHGVWPGPLAGIAQDQLAEASARLVDGGIAALKESGSPYLNIFYRMITEKHEQELRAIGSGFSAWTVNDEESLRLLLKMGIANITTRIPVLAMKLRKEIQGI